MTAVSLPAIIFPVFVLLIALILLSIRVSGGVGAPVPRIQVEDVQAGRLIRMVADGMTTTLATNLDAPEGVVRAPAGLLYVTESNVQFIGDPWLYRTRVTAISSTGEITPILTSSWFWSYAGIVIGPDGLLYVTNEASGIGTEDSIFTVDPAVGTRVLFASGLVKPEGLRFAADGNFPLYVVEEDTGGGAGRLSRVEAGGSHTPFCSGFGTVEDVVLDGDGRLYVSEDSSGSIVRIDPGPPERAHPPAIILFIGDGMGEAHRTAARWSAVGQNGALAMDPMPYGGWASTASADDPVTDSAAAATALATGVKTNNGMISMDPDLNVLTTILERAQARGMAVGLVTNVQMAHATPAAFAAHVDDRNKMTEIALQMLEAEVDVLLGGGEDEFLPITVTGCYTEPGERIDGRNLISEALALDYTYLCDAADLAAVNPVSTTRLLGLFADEGMPRPVAPSLAEMTQQAIDVLSQDPDGFFLMVEGGQIDWASHANDAAGLVLTDTPAAGVSYIPGSASTAPGLSVVAVPPPALVLTGALPVDDVLTATFGVTVSTVPSGTLLVNRATVMATDSDAVTSTVTHPVIAVPVSIDNLQSDSPVTLSDTMHFTAAVSGDTPITYNWDWGDGSPGQSGIGLSTVFYTYTAARRSTVSGRRSHCTVAFTFVCPANFCTFAISVPASNKSPTNVLRKSCADKSPTPACFA